MLRIRRHLYWWDLRRQARAYIEANNLRAVASAMFELDRHARLGDHSCAICGLRGALIEVLYRQGHCLHCSGPPGRAAACTGDNTVLFTFLVEGRHYTWRQPAHALGFSPLAINDCEPREVWPQATCLLPAWRDALMAVVYEYVCRQGVPPARAAVALDTPGEWHDNCRIAPPSATRARRCQAMAGPAQETRLLFSKPHRRYNPLSDSWVLVSPHRTQRPWLGQVERRPAPERPAYDPNCYLCPGNERAGGKRNPAYSGTYVFDNDFPALLPDTPPAAYREGDLLYAASERGIARVVCFSPRHDLALPQMDQTAVRRVVDVWAEQTQELGTLDFIGYVQVFENKGEMMGASNPHPHGQIWASEHVPGEPAREARSLGSYRAAHGTCLLCDYLALERALGERIVFEGRHWTALVPFWAVWPFEVMLLAHRHVGSLPGLDDGERDGLADAIRRITARYDHLFSVSFPYSMGFHQSPTDGQAHPEAHLHAHYYPPLLRSATVRKFMVGYEMLADPQRDLTPESAAGRLREMSESPGV